jgi:site-specific recombinase
MSLLARGQRLYAVLAGIWLLWWGIIPSWTEANRSYVSVMRRAQVRELLFGASSRDFFSLPIDDQRRKLELLYPQFNRIR